MPLARRGLLFLARVHIGSIDKLLAAQLTHDCGNVIFLEKANGRDSGCANLPAGLGVLQRHPSKRENWDRCETGSAKSIETRRGGSRRVLFLEDRSEDGQGGPVARGLSHIFRRMTGNGYQRISS